MEVAKAHGHAGLVFFAECFGTAALVYAVNMQAESGGFSVFGIAMVLFVQILMWGNISGANFNPAVTLSVFISRPK